jgi:thiosulfate reductase cytochrome b subunit
VTLPSWRDLSMGRRWHFFFAWLFAANLLVYLLVGLVSGHLKRDLLPKREQLRLRTLVRNAADHIRLKFPQGESARHYNPLQKLTYLAVIFLLLPAMILTGLAMSPGMDAIFPWLIEHLWRAPIRAHDSFRRGKSDCALCPHSCRNGLARRPFN